MIEPGQVSVKVCRGEYDFSRQGGAISTIPLESAPGDNTGNSIPPGAYILGGFLEVDTQVAGSGASVAISSEGSGDLVAAAAITGAPWSTTGRKAIIPVFTVATLVKTTAARSLAAVITGGALTAGKFRVVVLYI
jgi:hypothetical protein